MKISTKYNGYRFNGGEFIIEVGDYKISFDLDRDKIKLKNLNMKNIELKKAERILAKIRGYLGDKENRTKLIKLCISQRL